MISFFIFIFCIFISFVLFILIFCNLMILLSCVTLHSIHEVFRLVLVINAVFCSIIKAVFVFLTVRPMMLGGGVGIRAAVL